MGVVAGWMVTLKDSSKVNVLNNLLLKAHLDRQKGIRLEVDGCVFYFLLIGKKERETIKAKDIETFMPLLLKSLGLVRDVDYTLEIAEA